MEIKLIDSVYDELTAICLDGYRKEEVTAYDLLIAMMDHPDVPIHYPYHHFIFPAAMLTVACRQKGKSAEELKEMLETAKGRSKLVPPGACGNLGACGGGVGAGIFMSVFTGSSPHSGETWQWGNEITGLCLQSISTVCGPRCCKRVLFLGMQTAAEYIKEKLDVNLGIPEKIVCKYNEKNTECRLKECPFYVR